jgi:hypothetical protein
MSWNKKMNDPDFHDKYELNINPVQGGTYVPKGRVVISTNTKNPNRFKQPIPLNTYEAEDECIDFEKAKTFIGKKVSNGISYTITRIKVFGYPATFEAIDLLGGHALLSIAAVMEGQVWKVLPIH